MKLYNTLTMQKEEFVPIDSGEVKIYSCGPTVYDYIHIGNARPLIVFDVLRRYLEYRGHRVKFVQNFTDIDDKMIKRAKEEGVEVKALAEKFIAEYFADAEGLGIRPATVHPRATEHIFEIIEVIRKLEKDGYAYSIEGDVYFDTSKFTGYGKLSHQSVEELEAGKRVEIDERKRNPMDFVLWKAKKPGEPAWPSPWGEGRPGWHIECSVMAMKYLGETLDIHCGGRDLIFPHHENEIAQSEAATGKRFVNYWLHNGYINVDNEKMSKSLGNFFTVRDIAQKYDYEVIRFFMLTAHYRSPINFSADLLEQAGNGLERMYTCLRNLKFLRQTAGKGDFYAETALKLKLAELNNAFEAAMEDDLNTADAIAALFDIVKEINTAVGAGSGLSAGMIDYSYDLLKQLGGILGILQKEDEAGLDAEVEGLIEKRQEARARKDWKTADEIRDKLKQMGITLEDTPQGVKWSRK